MSREELRKIYRSRQTDFEQRLEKATRQINLISNLRLVVAVLFLGTLYVIFSQGYQVLLALPTLIAFFYLVKRHAVLFREKAHLENLVIVNMNEKKILEGNFSSFDPGSSFINSQHPYSHDLDIFGEGSIYQYINRCNTLNGRRKFATHLEVPFRDKESIVKQQLAVKDLSSRIDFRQHVQAAGMETGEQKDDYEQLLSWIRQPSIFKNRKSIQLILYVLPVITLLALGAVFFFSEARPVLMLCVMAQWILLGIKLKKINVFHDYISRKKNILEKYSRLLFYIENEKFESEKLKELSAQAHEAHTKVKKLASLVSALDARTNSIAALIVNSFLLYDLQCVYRLEKWREDNASKLAVWLDTLTEMEIVVSFGTFAFNHPSFQYANILEKLRIHAQQLAHPLIPEAERVINDITLGPEPTVLIITGANMAGKSTFLRTLGVNMVLALNGAPVCASVFECPVISMRSGMRTADSLKDHQSYFYAELNRLKNIMEELRSGQPLLILLDEILKGTNSNDKQAGSIALVRQLLPHPCLALIATHDLALGDLENEHPDKVKNYAFEANIENDQLSFDYKLKEGIAQKMNASFLMKKMGIIPS
jgi:DNA mismatch repair ATPase MutS